MTNAPPKPLWSTYFAYIGAFLGVMSAIGVTCFHYPDLLTSPSVRATYTEEFARILLAIGMTTTALLLIPCLIVGHYKRLSALGLLGLTLALVMGGTSVPLAPRNGSSFSLGLDWFLLALFFSALILVPLERFSGNSQQTTECVETPVEIGFDVFLLCPRRGSIYFVGQHIGGGGY